MRRSSLLILPVVAGSVLAGCGPHASTDRAQFVYDKKADRCFRVAPDTSLAQIDCTDRIRKDGSGAQVGWIDRPGETENRTAAIPGR